MFNFCNTSDYLDRLPPNSHADWPTCLGIPPLTLFCRISLVSLYQVSCPGEIKNMVNQAAIELQSLSNQHWCSHGNSGEEFRLSSAVCLCSRHLFASVKVINLSLNQTHVSMARILIIPYHFCETDIE